MKKESKKYKVGDIVKLTGEKRITVAQRFVSPYAKKRWGVVEEIRPDGSINRYVPEDKLYLWKNPPSYVGRPVFEDEK